jgi:hypothetical protein
MTALTQAHDMLQQLSLPIGATDTIKARRERAIRKSGLTASKGLRVWYGQKCSILADEWLTLCDRYAKHVEIQEQRLGHELEQLRAAKAQRLQTEFDLQAPQSTHAASVGVVSHKS